MQGGGCTVFLFVVSEASELFLPGIMDNSGLPEHHNVRVRGCNM
jgi:hypothetical protein